MISISDVRARDIRNHYDWTTAFYRVLWGRHIHHGLWSPGVDGTRDASPRTAQVRLIRALAAKAAVGAGQRLLDVGCGMGGSAIHLAREVGCDVTGLTLSPVQRLWAAASSRLHRVGPRARFLCRDAEQIEFPKDSFDVVWSVECTEHLFDKPAFLRRAAAWLRPGGRVAICAWLVGENAQTVQGAEQVRQVCAAFLCPSLGSAGEYGEWLTAAGLTHVESEDWTAGVVPTWEICERRVRRSGIHLLAKVLGGNTRRFLEHFETISAAYRSRAMAYGCFVATKARPGL